MRELRDAVNKEIEALRAAAGVGSSLQARVVLTVRHPKTMPSSQSLGEDLKFVFITSKVTLVAGEALAVTVHASTDTKCERCWHWRSDVGQDPAHPTICGRCVSNLQGAGETRQVA